MEIIWLKYIPTYVALCEELSIQKAAARMGCSNAHVSRQLHKLEEIFSSQLIHRTTRKFVLTRDGKDLYKYAIKLLEYSRDIDQQFKDSDNKKGNVSIALSGSFGVDFITPYLLKFNNLYPDIKLDIFFSEDITELIDKNHDLTICITNEPPESCIGIKVGELKCIPYAHKDYVNTHGLAAHPKELSNYEHIVYQHRYATLDSWTFVHKTSKEKIDISLETDLSVNFVPTMVKAVNSCCGVAMLDNFAISKLSNKENLVNILPNWETESNLPVYILYQRKTHLPIRVSLLKDYLKEALTKYFN
ncbi:LysR family transcriptional regulator [Vibrio harveyi]